MSRSCTICNHPHRADIEQAIIAGIPHREIASQYGVGYKSVQRHFGDHISQEIQQSQAAQEELQALNVVKQLREINDTSLAILKEARDLGQNGLALQAIDRITKQLELQAKLLGDIDKTEVNIWLPASWEEIERTIILALRPYTQAALAVSDALGKLDARTH